MVCPDPKYTQCTCFSEDIIKVIRFKLIHNRLIQFELIRFLGFLLDPDLRLEDDEGHGPQHVRLLLHLRGHLARLRVQVPLMSDITTTSSRTRIFRR